MQRTLWTASKYNNCASLRFNRKEMHDRSGETIRKHVYVRLREGKRLKMIVLNVAFWNSFCMYRNLARCKQS